MIDRLNGTCLAAGPTWAVVQVGGMGLKVLCTPATAAKLHPSEECQLFTTLVPREDSLTLYGFASQSERDCFELVQTASGVGPKLALSIVSVLSPADLAQAVAREDLKAITSVPGIGAKGAQKLVIELRDKVAALGVDETGAAPKASASGAWRDQVTAGLLGLGWSAKDAETACDRVDHLAADDPTVPVPMLMRAALQSLAR